jgi:molybdenum cofactor cytidylyltransferase
MTEVAAVVLAAGSSSRMGCNKLLLMVEGETLVRRAARAAVSAGLHPVFVILGHQAEQVGTELAGLPVRPLINLQHRQGVRTSLQEGVRAAAAAGVEALVVVLADMPFVAASMLETVVARHRETGAPLVLSRYGDVDAPPILYQRSLFDELLAIPEGQDARPVVRRHRDEAAVVPWPPQALKDVDVPGDYEQVQTMAPGLAHPP